MKWFWYSLIGFCVLMCSCRTQKLDSNVKVRSDIHSELAYLNENATISTQNRAYSANETQRVIIEEDITVTEYDKEGNKTKETNAKRKTTQDSDKVSAEEGQKRVESCSKDSLNHFRGVTNMMESEVEEESIGGQESFGEWFGIVLGLGCSIIIVYLLRKLRIN